VNDRDELTREIIGAAIDVHRSLGPGLLESTYEECLAFELAERGLDFQSSRVGTSFVPTHYPMPCNTTWAHKTCPPYF